MAERARRVSHEHEGACSLDVEILADAINLTIRGDAMLALEAVETGVELSEDSFYHRLRGDVARRLYREAVSRHLAELIALHYRTERLEQITGKPAEVKP